MTPLRAALRITAIYVMVGLVWILFSDRALELVVEDPATMMRLQTLKGWLYVIVTGVLFGSLAWITLSKQQRLHEYDSLTGLLNWYMFRDAVDSQLQAAKDNVEQLSLAVLNLDEFRRLNSQIGQRAGDALLQNVAEKLRTTSPTHATIGRVAADEFCIALRGQDAQREILQVVQRIQNQLQQSMRQLQTVDASCTVTCSVGIAVFPEDASHAKELITAANLALAEAKETGHGRVCIYSQSYSDRINRRSKMIHDLERALQTESNELYLVYQPQFTDPQGPMSSVEVLLRWSHPLHGNVPPDTFIELAEEHGLIGKLTDFVCAQALTELSASHLLDTLEYMSVNVSAHDINSPSAREDFARRFEHDADAVALVKAGKIQLEITETSVMQDKLLTIQLLQALKQGGYRISVDDFGTGYSSLSVISRLPVDELKIDRSFISSLRNDGNDLLIVRTIVAMAHALNLQVVAEGVENETQLRVLQELRCDRLQGYYLGRPVPLEQLKVLHGTGHSGYQSS